MYTILVPVDGSDHALKALHIAGDLAEKYQGRIVLLHVLARNRQPADFLRLEAVRRLSPELRQALEVAAAARGEGGGAGVADAGGAAGTAVAGSAGTAGGGRGSPESGGTGRTGQSRAHSRDSQLRGARPPGTGSRDVQLPDALLHALGAAILAQAGERLRRRGIAAVTLPVEEGRPAGSILLVADRMRANIIVMGCRGVSGASAGSFGSVSHAVFERARCTCISVK